MFKLLIADDEPVIIKGLKKIINWEEKGFQIVGEAENGEALWDLTLQKKPDLVLTDISMPHLTGIDYLKRLRNNGLETKVLFISAYEEFSYAQDAIAYGALGYLIKPINHHNLLNEISKINKILNKEEVQVHQTNELENYKEKAKKGKTIESIYEFIKNSKNIRNVGKDTQNIVDEFPHNYFSVVSLSINQPKLKEKTSDLWHEHEEKLLFFSVQNIIEDLLSNEFKGLILNQHENIFSIFLNHKNNKGAEEFSYKLVKRISEFLKINVYIGVGEATEELLNLKQSYESSMKHMNYYYFAAPIQVITSENIKISESRVSYENLTEQRQLLFKSVIINEKDSIENQLIRFFDWLYSISGKQKQILVSTCFTVMKELQDEIKELGIQINHLHDQLLLEKLYSLSTFEELKQFVRNQLYEMKQKMESMGTTIDNLQIKIVKDYIEENYKDNITLESMASLIHMNSYYFSSFFKKHTNYNFKKYLTEIRMKKALHLLLNSDLLVYEIAEEVGYRNVRQFSDMFKKYYGKLPNEYKKYEGNSVN